MFFSPSHRIRFILIALAFPFLAMVKSIGASQFPGQTNLEGYLQYAQSHNPELQAFEQWYQAALQKIPQASALPDPTLQITHFVESVQTRSGPQENAYQLKQSIPWFGSLHNQKGRASSEAEALWYAYQNKQLLLAQEVALIYYEYAYVGKAIELTRENLELLHKLEPIVTQKVRAGANLNSLLRLQVEIGKIEDTFL
ncbi:MAG: TolC family protein, partial [Opitutaceae bacterium]|nr:TolC family protein [Opitutaceae bacterium]